MRAAESSDAAGDDEDVGPRGAGGEGDEEILDVGVRGRHKGASMQEPGRLEVDVLGAVSEDDVRPRVRRGG